MENGLFTLFFFFLGFVSILEPQLKSKSQWRIVSSKRNEFQSQSRLKQKAREKKKSSNVWPRAEDKKTEASVSIRWIWPCPCWPLKTQERKKRLTPQKPKTNLIIRRESGPLFFALLPPPVEARNVSNFTFFWNWALIPCIGFTRAWFSR